jgi:hypothetical protein
VFSAPTARFHVRQFRPGPPARFSEAKGAKNNSWRFPAWMRRFLLHCIMSAFGTKRTSLNHELMSAFGGKADIAILIECGSHQCGRPMLISGRCHCGNISFTLDWRPEPSEIPGSRMHLPVLHEAWRCLDVLSDRIAQGERQRSRSPVKIRVRH